MPFEFTSRVRYSETDPEEKLTLYHWWIIFRMLTFQSEDCGVGTRFLKKQDLAWMILSWQIEILRRPYLAEPITAQTWPYGFKAFYGYRNYALVDAGKLSRKSKQCAGID
ncbi:MAG: acyl-ACP thioesterase domain-containing protein [Lachnospiraceae bacterium]